MSRPTIKALVVDLGGVAAQFRPARRLTALAALTGLGEELIHERLFQSGFDHRCELGELTAEQAHAGALGALDGTITADALIAAWSLAFEPDDAVLDHVRAIPARRVAFTNNGPLLDTCLAGPLRHLAATFDQVICSWHLRAAKPDPGSFERAAGRLGLAAEHLLLLDDSIANVEAARQLRWNAAVVHGVRDLADAVSQYDC